MPVFFARRHKNATARRSNDYKKYVTMAMTWNRNALLTTLLLWVLLLVQSTPTSNHGGRKLFGLRKRRERRKREAAAYIKLRQAGISEVGHTKEAKALRDYKLRKKKRKGLGVLRKGDKSLAASLFPGVTPEAYQPGEKVYMITELIQSKKTHVPFQFYDLPGCGEPSFLKTFERQAKRHQRKNLGARLQGMGLNPAPFEMRVLENKGCTALCEVNLPARPIKWLRKLINQQYRIHLSFDQLPVLMRSSKMNYAVRGYPIGFKAPPSYTGRSQDEFFLYNHLKFMIHYQKDAQSGGVFITGFDVYPVSYKHDTDGATCPGSGSSRFRRRLDEGDEDDDFEDENEEVVIEDDDQDAEESTEEYTEEDGIAEIVNDPETYLQLRVGAEGEALRVVYSYEIHWEESDLSWADRWDVYLIGSADDDIHFFAIINSLMIVLFLTGAIATIMIRTLKKDISAYNDVLLLEDGSEETGWKLIHGDVFRPPSTSPLALSVLVGTGSQIGMAFFITLMAACLRLVNPIKKGQFLTAILIVYVLCGSISGYVSARIYKFCDGKNWKMNTMLTAGALPGSLFGIFTVLNMLLGLRGASTAVSFLTLLGIFALWVCVSSPLVFVGSFFGYRADRVEIPSKVNQIARVIPDSPWYSTPPLSYFLGGILPFGSVCIELFFIMSALWLHQIYYVMGFLLTVLIVLAATCAEVTIVMTYLQLCAEDHRWWWKSFANCASAGVYLFGYSFWFLWTRLELEGFLPRLVYISYMGMISLCFGICCGSLGFLCAFYFNKTIYGALKFD
ncbi:hypothetical protein FisN_9Hh204 [Fistulifera solaris]|uniref:Transmembrane 9 superfamily member n=1 Tax=Fistulifera solaris TaxID=1519565 RepID=A0A1Z5JAT2_FISSO|nr:hypothetical protein FisN_9Hh204 [Fistulifera solaris]|eukprot:GAX11113.1 hypothetical protein FisN_9Hh204 [Fistulifera solaris]